MKKVNIISDNIINSLGFNTTEVFDALRNGKSGIRKTEDRSITPSPVPLSLVDNSLLEEKFNLLEGRNGRYTRMEKMFIVSIADALRRSGRDLTGKDTLLIISTTKGNIDLLGTSNAEFPAERAKLWKMADEIAGFFGFVNRPMVVSNACISGLLAINTGFRFIRSGIYKNVVVAGGDMVTEFVVSGFLSFQALSPEPCKPFDQDRTGLNIGEGCGTMVLSDEEPAGGENITVTGTAITNDANHISGPSRTGEELALAITRSLDQAGIDPGCVSFISAHGTATPYNDEMESKAIAIAGVQNAPVNSFKGYWGHTLGAAGVIESVATVHSMRENLLIASKGFETPGTPEPLKVIRENSSADMNDCLKIASGFGGCNGAIIFHKEKNSHGK